jgi:hypothetical protein
MNPIPQDPVNRNPSAWRLLVSFQSLKRCSPESQSLNLNQWIYHEKNNQLFFRFDRMYVRAIFTPHHILANNFEVMKKLDSLEYGSDTQIQCSLDPEFMSLSILDGRK